MSTRRKSVCVTVLILWFIAPMLHRDATLSYAGEQGLVGYWKFDEGSGDTVKDSSGKGYDGNIVGAEWVNGKFGKALQFNGSGHVEIPDAEELKLGKKGITIEAWVYPTEIPGWCFIVNKNDEYQLRIDPPQEGNHFSFLVYSGGSWEPRASNIVPALNIWYHVMAVWDKEKLQLWIDGKKMEKIVVKKLIQTDNPVLIGSGFFGMIDEVSIYNRALSEDEIKELSLKILKKTYGIKEKPDASTIKNPVFDFSKGLQGWTGKEGASVSTSSSGLIVKTTSKASFIMNNNLNVGLDNKNYMSMRMSVSKGSTAEIIFITDKATNRIPIQIVADGKMHNYAFESWMWPGWAGNLVALGIVPSDIENATVQIEYVRITEELQGDPEMKILNLFSASTLPRAEKTETIIARVQNAGSAGSGISATLNVPAGVSLKSSASQDIPKMEYLEEKDMSWQVEVSEPLSGEFKVEVSGGRMSSVSTSNKITFFANPQLPKASYVPEPVPVKSKYNIWMHYCPLWKQGTHYGWKLIEPWSERKPVIGWYNEGTPEVADWHIKYCLEHGISAIIYCWYRTLLDKPTTVQNLQIGHAMHDGLFKAKYLPMIKFAIMWENGCGKGASSVKDLMENVFPFWLENYFLHPSYLKVDGKPVLYVWVPQYVTRDLKSSANVSKAFDAMREECKKRGLNGLYIVGCTWTKDRDRSILETMVQEGWDASSNYGFSGGWGWAPPTGTQNVGNFISAPYEGLIEQQDEIWKFKRDAGLLPDIIDVMMGGDARPWKSNPLFWSGNTPDKFKILCQRAKAMVDSTPTSGPEKNTIIFCNWNEFGEGHYIEPTRGYGFSYVDVIRDIFTNAPKQHTDIAPQDVGLASPESWYVNARKQEQVKTGCVWKGATLGAWGALMNISDFEFKDGIIRGVSITDDPAFDLRNLKIRANKYSKFIVEMKVSKSGTAQVFWLTPDMLQHNEPGSVRVSTEGDGEFHEYTFDVGSNEFWAGCVTELRIDPTPGEGVTMEIRSIRLE